MVIQELIQKIGFSVDDHQLEHLHEKLEGIHKAVEIIAGVELIKGLAELAEKFSSFGEHLEATSIAAGLTTDELQKLQYAASQNAVDGDALAMSLARLNRALYSAKQGSKQTSAVFAKLGISREQLMTFDNSAQALGAIQDALRGVTSANERQALVMQLFGRGSSGMIKFLLQGSEATKNFGEQAEKLGAVVDERTIKSLAEFEGAMISLKSIFKSFFATIAGTFAPAFKEIVNTIKQSWASNIGSMREALETFSIKAAFYLGFTTEAFRVLFAIVSGFARDHMGLLLFVAKWAPIFFAASAAFELFTGAVKKGKAALMAFAKIPKPLLLFGGWALAIGAVVVALHDLYEVLWNGKSFRETWLVQILEYLNQYLGPVGQKVRDLFGYFGQKIMGPEMMTPEETAASLQKGPMSVMAQAPSLFGGAQQMGMKFDPSDTSLAAGPVSTRIRLDAPITINVPPGMSTRDAIRVSREGVSQGLMDMLNQAQRDMHPAAAR